jgi:CRISPR-associated protein Cmr3
LIHRSELCADEMRTGLGLEAGDRRSEDHMLYTYGFVRMRVGVGLGFEVRGTRLTAGGRVRLGGEGRTCRLEAGRPFPAVTPETAASPDGCFRVALATPALSEAGGYPPGFSPATRLGSMGGRRLRLVGAVMGGFILAGGWDVARGRAKPLRRALPPGSVFLFEDREAGAAAALDGINVSDFRSESLALQGFGLVMAGAEP